MAKAATVDYDPDADLQVYERHRAGLPAMRPYFRDLRQRLPFASEFSRTSIRAANVQTVFGQIWLVLNPLLLAMVYVVLVTIISPSTTRPKDYLSHVVCGLFFFYFIQGSILTGATSVTKGGRLIMNTAFPRLLMPVAAVRTAFFRFLPTLPVFLIFRLFSGHPWNWHMLLGIGFLGYAVLFSMGLAALFATATVYFRDTSSFLPYFLRIWMYLSPVLWYPDNVSARLKPLMVFNPLYSMVGGWTEATLEASVPGWHMWLEGAVWAVVALVAGSLVFMARERDFTVRL